MLNRSIDPMTYLSDILEQPRVLHSLIDRYRTQNLLASLTQDVSINRYQQVVLTGMGSSFYGLFPTWLYLNQCGVPAIHIEASELIHYGLEMLNDKTLLVIVSQSGESIEIQRLIQAVGDGVTIVSVTNSQDNTLANHSHIALCTDAGTEVPVATKTYTSGLGLLHLLARSLTGNLLSRDYKDLLYVADQMTALLKNWQDWLEPLAIHLQSASFYSFLGRGPAIASAMVGALILREAARLNSVGLSGGQFRHGPMEAVSPSTGMILFSSPGRTAELSQRLAADIASHEGRVVLVGQSAALPVVGLALPAVDEFLSPIIEIVVAQLLAARFAENAGIVPGEFRWAGKVIQAE